jgi:hypothetical protein
MKSVHVTSDMAHTVAGKPDSMTTGIGRGTQRGCQCAQASHPTHIRLDVVGE